MPDRVYEGDVREPAPLEPARRVRGKSAPAAGEPPLPPPPVPPPEGERAPEPALPPRRVRLREKSSLAVRESRLSPLPDSECPPEQALPKGLGVVGEAVEQEFRASRFSVVDLEGFAKELLLEDWDLEEAMWVLVQFSRLQSLKAGLYRHGGVVGTTSVTNSHSWLTELMAATLLSVSPEAEFTSLWLSNTNPMSLHADHNNVEGSVNVVLPLKLPPEGGDLWVELRAGDVLHGPVEQRVDGAGKKWLGATRSLQRGKPFYLDPKRRHATTPFEGERVVLVAYTVNTLGKVPESELQALESLGFPLPASARLPLTTQQDVRRLDVFDMFEEGPLELASEDSSREAQKVDKGGGWKETQKVEAGTVELEVSWNLKHTPDSHTAQREQAFCALQTLEPQPPAQVEEEPWPEQPVQWELSFPSPQTGEWLCALRSDDLDPRLCKSEPVYTPDIEQLLSGLTEPLQIVHTVDPREAEKHSEVWLPSVHKEIGVIEKAVRSLPPGEVRKGNWLHRTDVRVVPAKMVFTVKPPDVQAIAPENGEHAAQPSLFKRKARLVACGNHAPSTGTEIYASGAAAESLRCLVVISSKRRWMLGILDVTSAFLLTPIPQGDGFPVFALTPPRYLVRQGLAQEGELWILTHAVYGLRESPKLWSDFRDSQLLALRCVVNGVELQLLKGKLDTNWWRVVQTSDGQAYAEELLRLNNVKPTALGKIPCPRDLVSFDTLLTDESPAEESVRTAQRLTGEILWLSQRTRPDLAFTACVLATLSTKAPERAARIAERALAYVQQTKAFALTADADDTGLVAYSDASFAPDGNRSHTGWVVFLHGSPVCWRSARQAFVTLSTAESELVAGLDAVVALQSAEAMLGEFGVVNLGKTLRVDSQSALAIAIGQGSWRTRHLRVRANYLREQYETGEIIPVYCPGVEQAADLLTKALPSARISELLAIWGLLEYSAQSTPQVRLVFCCPALPVVLSVGRISNTLGIPYAFCKGRRITPSYSCGRGLGTHVDMPAEPNKPAQTAVECLRYMVVKLNLERKKKRLAEKKRKRNLHDLKRFPRIFLMCDSASASWVLRQLDPNRTILVVDEPPMGSDVYPEKPEDNPLACAMMQAMMTPMYKTILMSATLPRPAALPTLVNSFLERFHIPAAEKDMHIRECMSTELDRGAVMCGPSGAVAFPHQNVSGFDELKKLCLRLPADPLVLKAYTERAMEKAARVKALVNHVKASGGPGMDSTPDVEDLAQRAWPDSSGCGTTCGCSSLSASATAAPASLKAETPLAALSWPRDSPVKQPEIVTAEDFIESLRGELISEFVDHPIALWCCSSPEIKMQLVEEGESGREPPKHTLA
ncbi:GIP [Symbiodinium natans]|uniref:GIP protein n=1 Tax=Symbiodinium natans TaxID=878477 RepID=A0A812UD54_9DINO|nr:GIP [Symbiodinium natans]